MNEFMESFFSDLTLLDFYVADKLMVLRVASRSLGNPCPKCGQWANRVHSTYYRTVQDIPICGKQVVLRIRSRKFFCDQATCEQSIFTERFDGLLSRSQQKTSRLNQLLSHLAFELGGNPGATLARQMGIVVSRDTLLHRIRETDIVEPPTMQEIHIVGIDDWAYRRGERYGTLICDIEHHRVIDVLADRRVDTVAGWLKKHPDIQIVSRDRAGAYADAIRQGLPHAVQVADRWHLLKNLSDAVHRYLTRQHLPLREKKDTSKTHEDKPHPTTVSPISHPRSGEQLKTVPRDAKWKRVQEVQQLHQSGVGKREIARRTGLSRQTISTYLTWEEVPTVVRSKRNSLLDPFREKVNELVCQSMRGPAILRQLRELGYIGSRATMGHYLAECRKNLRKDKLSQETIPQISHRHHVSPHQATVLLSQKEDQLDEQGRLYRDLLLQEVKGAKDIHEMCLSFRALMERRDSTRIEEWLETAMQSGIQEMRSFARGIRKDLAAVSAGIGGPWSNGQLEGQINRLKMLKRQMFGRAGFDLLRARVLYHA